MTASAKNENVPRDAVVFDVILLVIFLVFATTALRYNAKARSIPMVVAIVGALMMSLQLLADAVPRTRARLRFVGERGLLGRASSPGRALTAQEGTGEDEGEDTADVPAPSHEDAPWTAVFRLVGWLFGFTALLAGTNYLLAVGLFTVLVTRLEGGASWVKAAMLAVVVDASFYTLFELILGARL